MAADGTTSRSSLDLVWAFVAHCAAEGTMSDILILTHTDHCTPGHLAQLFRSQQLDYQVLRVDRGELAGVDLDRPKAVAIMGGAMSVNDPLPWLTTEVEDIQHFLQRDIPMIGHCLGGQLLAKALGAEVRTMAFQEVGQ